MSFCGQRLKIAREFRALTQSQLAQKVSASTALISLCEAGKNKRPARDFVEACGVVLGFEPAFFYAPLEDVFREDECNFRHRGTTPERIKTQVRAHGTLIGLVIEMLRSRRLFPPINVPSATASSSEHIELAAERCRQHWNLDSGGSVPQLRTVLEAAGVIVIDGVVKSNKVDTFSRYGARMAVIFPNEEIQSSSVWNIEIAHELGHMVMHRGIRTGTIQTETEADAFAGAFLMPGGAFGREFQERPFSLEHVFRLKKRWNASAVAIVERAYDLRLIGAVEYRAARKQMYRKVWNKREPHESPSQQPGMFTKVLNGLGQKATLTIDLPIEKLCERLCFTTGTFYGITGIAIPPRDTAPSGDNEMPSALPVGSPNPSEPAVATTPASGSASMPVIEVTGPHGPNSEPPKNLLKPTLTPEELGVLGLNTIPAGAEVVWMTSSEDVAELARNKNAHPIVVMREWTQSLRDHPVFRDAKLLWHIRPVWSRYDPEMEADQRLQESLEVDPQIKSRLLSARANSVPAEAFQETATPLLSQSNG